MSPDLLRKALEYLEGSDPLMTSGGHKNQALCDEIRARLSQAGAGGVDAGEPFGWVVGPVFFEEDPGALLGKRAVFVATPPAPVQTASVEAVAFQAGLDAAAEYLLACDDYGDRMKADEIRKLALPASLTAPTQGDGAPLVKAMAVVRMFKERIERHGNWDDGCFYYGRTSASELQEPLRLAADLVKEVRHV